LSESRKNELERFKSLLNTENGLALMAELEGDWDAFNLLGATPQDTAYGCGKRDAFKYLKQLQSGELIR